MNDQTITLNQNSAECIKTITGIGSSVYQNICSGASVTVPWGMGDWVLAIGACAFLTAIIGVFGSLGWLIWRDRY